MKRKTTQVALPSQKILALDALVHVVGRTEGQEPDPGSTQFGPVIEPIGLKFGPVIDPSGLKFGPVIDPGG